MIVYPKHLIYEKLSFNVILTAKQFGFYAELKHVAFKTAMIVSKNSNLLICEKTIYRFS
jgi:hypothetical protein